MSTTTPRLRMFAGPNGSGKSTLKSYLPVPLLGEYLNPDEIEQDIHKMGFLNFSAYGILTTADEARCFFTGSAFLKSEGMEGVAAKLGFTAAGIDFAEIAVNSYLASVAVDFLRQKLLAQRESFTFETVMSHESKVQILTQAQAQGYRTYLYYVATDDPSINVSRVANRVALGGHTVPENKIVSRYHRSLDLLLEAIRHTNRAYVFDNSGENGDGKHTWLAEITDGKTIEVKTDHIPGWFKRAVMDKII
ncbi:zeta toxin family protein [soil metagenome]